MHIVMFRFYGELTSRIALGKEEQGSSQKTSGGDLVREVAHQHFLVEGSCTGSRSVCYEKSVDKFEEYADQA